jgi:peptidoglycan hydrolase-like protein with peptidoglycan-binding domain
MQQSRRRAAATPTDRPRRPLGLSERPDRLALWAVLLALVAMVAAAASAEAGSSGGIGGPGGDPTTAQAGTPGCPQHEFGRRTLRMGDCGGDVQTLNWILKSAEYRGAPLADRFKSPTERAVRGFQSDAGLGASGVVNARTSSALVQGMPSQRATWYGPGFFGNRTACGQRLTRRTVGVAHRKLPCGSKVVLRYKGAFVRTTVIDRGPFANGAKWDLTQATARALGFAYTDEVRVAAIAKR